MKVGVVIISYNNESHIEAAIKSVQNQTLTDWTCVMVDNGSIDQSFEIMEGYSEGNERFKAFKKTNEGPGPGRNLAFSKLPEDISYIHFLDGDDVLYPDFLLQMTAYLDKNPEVGLVCCQFDEIDDEGTLIGKGKRSRYAPNRWGLPHDIPLSVNKTPFVSFFSSTGVGPFSVFRRSVYVKTPGYTIRKQEDVDVFCHMSLVAEVHAIPQYLYQKRRTTYNLSHAPKYMSRFPAFRNKWDLYHSSDPETNRMIEESVKYYYKIHKPLRDFKVGLKAFRIFLKKGEFHSLKWSLTCFWNGAMDLIFHKKYRRIMRNRKEIKNNPDSKMHADEQGWDVFESDEIK